MSRMSMMSNLFGFTESVVTPRTVDLRPHAIPGDW